MVIPRQSPIVRRRRLAATLRRLRAHTGLTAGEAARRIERDASWLSRIENADVRPHPHDVRALLGLYGVAGEQAEAVLTVARQARLRGWWQRYSDVLPDWFATYVGLEFEAATIRTYACQAVPSLLQTEQYARAALRGIPAPRSTEEVERLVALRLKRQDILGGADPPQLRVVVDEGAIRRVVGGVPTMRDQIRRLIERSESPNIELRMLPFTAGPTVDGSFVILDIPPLPEPYPDVLEDRTVYIDALTAALWVDRPADVAWYAAAHDQLEAKALPPEPTRDALRRIAINLTA